MLYTIKGKKPKVHKNAFVAENAYLVGDVTIEEDVSIWFGAVVRGDENPIFIGRGTNIQDNVTVHVSPVYSTYIGEDVNIGHNAIVHACTVGKRCLIGIGSVILDGAAIGEGTLIGAGSVVGLGKKIPAGVLCVGSPAKVIRELTEEEKAYMMENAEHYVKVSKEYLSEQKIAHVNID